MIEMHLERFDIWKLELPAQACSQAGAWEQGKYISDPQTECNQIGICFL